MLDYQFRYRLQSAPSASTDGSGMVQHDIYALASSDGDSWVVVPGRHKTVSVPAADMAIVMDMPHGTGPEKSAKTTTYKAALAANVNTAGIALTGWTTAQLEALMDANDSALAQATAADSYITVTLSQSYPVEFNL